MSRSWKKEANHKIRKPRYQEDFDLSIVRVNRPIESHLLDGVLEDEKLLLEEKRKRQKQK